MPNFQIPRHWAPHEALAVYELIGALHQAIAARYQPQLAELMQAEQNHREPNSEDENVDIVIDYDIDF